MEIVITDHTYGAVSMGAERLARRRNCGVRIARIPLGASYPFPERFDHQGTVDVTGYLAARTSFETIEQRYGWDFARAYMQRLGDYAETIVSDALSEQRRTS